MKICKKCGNEFEQSHGLLNYCSLSCRNSRIWTVEDKLKKSISNKNSEKVKFSNRNKPIEVWKKIGETRKKNHRIKLMSLNYDDLGFESLRMRIYYEQDGCCNRCKLNKWLNSDIPLELEHKDGNHFNNKRDNLELLCPNCHALTDTWRGRNKTKQMIHKISDEKLFEILLINNWNMRQSLIQVGLAAKGGNYNRCHRLKREYFALL